MPFCTKCKMELTGHLKFCANCGQATSILEVYDNQPYHALYEDSQPNSLAKSFEDKKTGITLQYPSDWQIASKEYMDKYFGNGPVKTNPVVILYPEFNPPNEAELFEDQASFSIVYDILLLTVSPEILLDGSKQNLLSLNFQISNIVPIRISNLDGYKYDVSFNNGPIEQTQIIFPKGSTAFIISYNLGDKHQSKDLRDINTIIDSIKIK